eukprot:CAMPEP_0175975704 /NCGR_PEP_ID=MMETSP0108-20121206/44114_1 /TAXON_ID=195067 ORGANISM="Goniomonas pacifica, Strain CCMP1869" /NCGR_SAMPLE_ID=MMETSP0108 /ASSEMBLY_ACC=CAM_ASM_000204 /LENGTH=40 /DNA_ID= /DNA_START= /DNA_END= /DNA_ORIENTATION=
MPRMLLEILAELKVRATCVAVVALRTREVRMTQGLGSRNA